MSQWRKNLESVIYIPIINIYLYSRILIFFYSLVEKAEIPFSYSIQFHLVPLCTKDNMNTNVKRNLRHKKGLLVIIVTNVFWSSGKFTETLTK